MQGLSVEGALRSMQASSKPMPAVIMARLQATLTGRHPSARRAQSPSSLRPSMRKALTQSTSRQRRVLTAASAPAPMKCPAEAGHNCGNGMRIQTAQSLERQGADRQPLVTTGAGGGYLPIGALPTGYLPTGAGAGGGGSLRGRSAAAATLSIAKDAASAVRIFSMM